ncbi:GNAT family N-acetyltransferase [Kitasatospora sp. NPDC096147]|uniref:GNAT family N-acetyltransferase n=1 Tax=Kitasatospora sp. NPDC096147 TaxID=3364093 RepID=UPI003801D0A2
MTALRPLTELYPLTADQLPELNEALEAHGLGGAPGPDGQRMAVLARSLADGDAVVARLDGRIVGYAANRQDWGGGFALVESAGEVLGPWRRRGVGTALLDWTVSRTARTASSALVELVVDCPGTDTGLRALLAARRFSEAPRVVVSAPVRPLPAASPGLTFRPLRPGDAARMGEVHRRATVGEVRARGGQGALGTTLRDPCLRRDSCLLATLTEDGPPVGFALTLTRPTAPHDLWIDTLCADPAAPHPAVARALAAEVIRRAPALCTTVSLCTTEAHLPALAGLGFHPARHWSRYSLLLVAAP